LSTVNDRLQPTRSAITVAGMNLITLYVCHKISIWRGVRFHPPRGHFSRAVDNTGAFALMRVF
jgi:hypothetical protein